MRGEWSSVLQFYDTDLEILPGSKLSFNPLLSKHFLKSSLKVASQLMYDDAWIRDGFFSYDGCEICETITGSVQLLMTETHHIIHLVILNLSSHQHRFRFHCIIISRACLCISQQSYYQNTMELLAWLL